MDNREFIKNAKLFAKLELGNYLKEGQQRSEEPFVVWSSKILQNNKAMLSDTFEGAPYVEVTYNGDKDEYYIDTYIKQSNQCVKCNEE